MSCQLIKAMVEDKGVAQDCKTMRSDAIQVLLSVVLDPLKKLIILSNNHRIFIVRMLLEAIMMERESLSKPYFSPKAIQLYNELNAWITRWRASSFSEEIESAAPRLSFLNKEILLVDRSSCSVSKAVYSRGDLLVRYISYSVSKVDYMRANSGDRPFILIDDSARNFRSNQSRNLNEKQYYHVNREDRGFQTRLLADIYACALEKLQSRESLDPLPTLPPLRM